MERPTTILAGIVGSRAYGLDHPGSDTDLGGIFIAPLRSVLGVTKLPETVTHNDPDFTTHEVGKYMRLAIANNPTALEYLWLDDYILLEEAGHKLIRYREQFLSLRVRQTYGGYARQQLKRLLEKGNFAADLGPRTGKHARHMTRLIIQGKGILETGQLTVRLTEFQANLCKYMGDLAVENPIYFSECANLMLDDLENCESYLPEKPNASIMDSLLFDIRMDHHVKGGM